MNEKYLLLKDVVTPEIAVVVTKEDGAIFDGASIYMDADEELIKIAEFIKSNSSHNEDIEPNRIKYLYTTQAKKDGGKFVLGQLEARKLIEKMVNDEFDYILSVYYKCWKELDIEQKVIQLDKLLCGVALNSKKKSVDSKEYINNLRHFGAEKVLKSTEIVDLTIDRIIEQEKDEKKNGPTIVEENISIS